MTARLLLALFAVALLLPSAGAQTPPSEARIRADVIAQVQPTATSVTLRGNGSRQLNAGVWEFVHSITTRKPYAEMAGVEIESYGDVVYQSHGATYQYDRYRTGDWRYFGIPDPTEAEVLAALTAEAHKAYPFGTLALEHRLELTDGETYWHNPEAVTVPYLATFVKADRGDFVTYEAPFTVRLTRDGLDGPWQLGASPNTDGPGREVARAPIPADTKPPYVTLRDAEEIAVLEAAIADLPVVEAPVFTSGRALADFVYEAARTDDPAHLEATIRAVIDPEHIANGSEVVLTFAARQDVLAPALAGLTEGPYPFSQLACPSPTVGDGTDTRVQFLSILQQRPDRPYNLTYVAMVVRTRPVSGGYRDGQALPPRYALVDVDVFTQLEDDDRAYLASLRDPAALCVASAAEAVQDAVPDAAGAREAVEGTVREGRRRLGRLLGRGN